MAGISEVARRAGVSRTTVSHVFSGKRPVADATRLRVLAAAQALKYNPDSMARGQAWRFLEMGRRIERAAFIAQLLRDTLVEADADPVLLEAVLEIADSKLTYRRRYFTHLEAHAVADLLLVDESNPRAVAFQLAAVDQHLATCPRDTADPSRNLDQRLVLKLRTAIQLCDLVQLCAAPQGRRRTGLDGLLSDALEQTGLLSDAIANLYFSHTDVSRKLGAAEESM